MNIQFLINLRERIAMRPAKQCLKELHSIDKETNIENLVKKYIESNIHDSAQWIALSTIIIQRELGITLTKQQMAASFWLCQEKVINMDTGEGKTLVGAVASSYLSIVNKQCRVITANQYLADRDCKGFNQIYSKYGITSSFLEHELKISEKQNIYNQSKVIYTTSDTLGFDYLKDRITYNKDDQAHTYKGSVIVDEIDSILIDDATTPLVIGSPSIKEDDHDYVKSVKWSKSLIVEKSSDIKPEPSEIADAIYYPINGQIDLTEKGYESLESYWLEEKGIDSKGIYQSKNIKYLYLSLQSLKAIHTLKKNIDYIVEDDSIYIIDKISGRVDRSRRWSKGIHQILEAYENVTIKQDQKTLATISLQNYLKNYDHICGMSGTANEVAVELNAIFGLETISIPRSSKCKVMFDDLRLSVDKASKYRHIIEQVSEANKKSLPVLIGTPNIDEAEEVFSSLIKEGLDVKLLTAKNDFEESKLIADAGIEKSITVSTSITGRGTDIVVPDAVNVRGGLQVIASSVSKDYRIDKQLMGRTGRQGASGTFMQFISPDDDIVKRSGSTKLNTFINLIGLKKEFTVSSDRIDQIVNDLQKEILFDDIRLRYYLVEIDNVIDKHRHFLYELRDFWLQHEKINEIFLNVTNKAFYSYVFSYCDPKKFYESWNTSGLRASLVKDLNFSEDEILIGDQFCPNEFAEITFEKFRSKLKLNDENLRNVMLMAFDVLWVNYIEGLSELLDNSKLQSYIGKKPEIEYQIWAGKALQKMVRNLGFEILKIAANYKRGESDDL